MKWCFPSPFRSAFLFGDFFLRFPSTPSVKRNILISLDCLRIRSDRIWLECTAYKTNEPIHKTERFSHSAVVQSSVPDHWQNCFWILNVPKNDWYNRGTEIKSILSIEWVHNNFDFYRFRNQGNNILLNCHVLGIPFECIDIFDIWCQKVVINYIQFEWEKRAKVLSPAYTIHNH